MASSAYERQASRLILKGEYLKTLTAGVHEFTLVTDGGEAKFTVTVNFSGINFTDTQRVKKYSVSNVSFSVDLGGNQPARVTVAGAEVGAEAWTYADGALTFKKAYLEPLSDGVYDIRVFDNGGKYENCVVVKGMEPADLLRFDADAFSHETNGFGQDLKISTEANGIDGFPSRRKREIGHSPQYRRGECRIQFQDGHYLRAFLRNGDRVHHRGHQQRVGSFDAHIFRHGGGR